MFTTSNSAHNRALLESGLLRNPRSAIACQSRSDSFQRGKLKTVSKPLTRPQLADRATQQQGQTELDAVVVKRLVCLVLLRCPDTYQECYVSITMQTGFLNS